MEFTGKVVAVTGAGSGIGRETALAFAARGARLAIADVNPERLEEARAMLEAGGSEVLAVQVDVSREEQVAGFCDAVYERFGRCDVLVNNAGVGVGGVMEHLTLEDWRFVLGINLWGVVYGCHFFYPRMIEQGGGHIVNLSSGVALGFLPGLLVYNCSKSAVLGLTESLRAEAARHHVGVTAICPGIVRTNITADSAVRAGKGGIRSGITSEKVDRFYARRNYTPDRVAAAILKAVERNRAVVPVAPESYVIDWTHRLSRGLYGLIARTACRLTMK
jgi:NAD(P)-dependent dehydrogenase (short-subunit alcohol dehydrogenase family)